MPVLRTLAAMLAVFVAAALAQSVLEERAARARRAELALTRIQSRVFLQSLFQQRALDAEIVGVGVSRGIRKLNTQISASVAELPRGPALEEVRVAVASYRTAVRENLGFVDTGQLDLAQIHDSQKVGPWLEALGRSLDAALRSQQAVGDRTDRLTRTGSLAALLLACSTIGFLLWRFERAKRAASTERQRALEESEARFRALVHNSSDIITVIDREGRLSYVSPSATRGLGRQAAELVGLPLRSIIEDAVHPEDAGAFERFLDAVAANPPDRVEFTEYRIRADGGDWRFMESSATNSMDDPYVCGIVITSRDISRRKSLEEQLRHQAFHDSLTHLPNRALFLDRLQLALARRSIADTGLAVLLIDLDGFKQVNDTLGHDAGDQLLIEVADRLTQCLRPADSVSRLGGDEFAVLVDDLKGGQDAAFVSERMLDALMMPFVLAGREIFVRASIGIVLTDASERSADDLLRDADVAMYVAKSEGGNHARVFEPQMRHAVMRRMTLEADLRAAVDTEQIAVVYQPIVELATGRIKGMEALVRWQHPQRGMLPPDDFVPLAEETGLIVPIGRQVLEEACRQLSRWHRRHPVEPPLSVSVNLSSRQVQDPGLVSDVRDVVSSHGLPSGCVTLELTESVLMEQVERTAETLDALRATGVRLAIDDFGTGYSSLSYLQSFPIEVLKIDRAFIRRVALGPEDSALTRAIVKLANTLDLGVVAEGIEEQTQLDTLLALGCPHGQGYLFAAPLTVDEMDAFLADRDETGGRRPRLALTP
jgi:diguanylate cyclase (GGDEF)-like protein/PAS domain S-box-containing protein